jgi:tetratricopeptide (TPR) repeat protein
VEEDPRLAEARYHLAFALSSLGDYEGALAETRRALELDPFYPAPRYRLLIDLQFEEAALLAPELDAMALVRAGQKVPTFAPGSGELSRAFDGLEAPGSTVDTLATAREALERGQLDRAAEMAQRAAAGTDAAEQLLLQGEIFLRQGLAGEAMERFAAVGETVPGEPGGRAWLGVARAALVLGRASDALDAADQALKRIPDDPDALRVRARALSAAGRHDEAASTLEGLRDTGMDAATLTDLGSAYLGAGRLEEAEHALQAAVAEDEGSVAARSALGHLLARTGRTHEASRQYEAALEILPSYGDAALPLAELHRENGSYPEAVRVLVDLLGVDPYHLDALTRLAMVLYEAGRRDQAATALRRVLRIDPGNEAARTALARVAPGQLGEAPHGH